MEYNKKAEILKKIQAEMKTELKNSKIQLENLRVSPYCGTDQVEHTIAELDDKVDRLKQLIKENDKFFKIQERNIQDIIQSESVFTTGRE